METTLHDKHNLFIIHEIGMTKKGLMDFLKKEYAISDSDSDKNLELWSFEFSGSLEDSLAKKRYKADYRFDLTVKASKEVQAKMSHADVSIEMRFIKKNIWFSVVFFEVESDMKDVFGNVFILRKETYYSSCSLSMLIDLKKHTFLLCRNFSKDKEFEKTYDLIEAFLKKHGIIWELVMDNVGYYITSPNITEAQIELFKTFWEKISRPKYLATAKKASLKLAKPYNLDGFTPFIGQIPTDS